MECMECMERLSEELVAACGGYVTRATAEMKALTVF